MGIKKVFTVCAYCGKEVPDGIQPEVFECCGEIGHTMEVDGPLEAPQDFFAYQTMVFSIFNRERKESLSKIRSKS